MRLFVTGCGGFVGSAIADRARELGWEVAGVDRQPCEGGQWLAADLSEPGAWGDALRGVDVVVHTAAQLGNKIPPDVAWRSNVLATRNVAATAASHGVKRLIHFSSVRVYSDVDFPDGVDETHPVRPDGHVYVDTKIAAEVVALAAHAAGEVACTILRPGDIYGPRSLPWTLWPLVGLRDGSFAIPAEHGVFSPIYIDDLVTAVFCAIERDHAAGKIYNVSGGVGVSNADFFGRYATMLRQELPRMPSARLREHFERIGVGADTVDYFLRQGTYSIARAQRELDFVPRIDLDEGMRRIAATM